MCWARKSFFLLWFSVKSTCSIFFFFFFLVVSLYMYLCLCTGLQVCLYTLLWNKHEFVCISGSDILIIQFSSVDFLSCQTFTLRQGYLLTRVHKNFFLQYSFSSHLVVNLWTFEKSSNCMEPSMLQKKSTPHIWEAAIILIKL